MYGVKNYVDRGSVFVNNRVRPGRKKLSTLMLYATDLCDSACKHCLIWAKRPVKHLSLEKIIEIMNDRTIGRSTTVGLEGGEFLIHPQAFDIMQWYYNNHKNFDLLTNCLKPKNAIEAVSKYPPSRLFISLDGTSETYKYMRGKDGYDSVIEVIEKTHKKVPISLMFTLSPYNDFNDLQHVCEVAKKYDIDVRVGVYNDIAFFDTVEKAHESDIGEVKDDKRQYKFKDVREELGAKYQEKNESLAVLERENIQEAKHQSKDYSEYKDNIPQIVKDFRENYDFLVMYDEWRRKQTKLKCFSILDSAVILPDGNVPICQNLDLILGNIHEKSLDEIFNSKATQAIQNEYVHNCNQCWINFHRKYDIVLYRTFEKFFPKSVVQKLFGYYQWSDDADMTYKQYMEKQHQEYS